jgi:hypothetical protein
LLADPVLYRDALGDGRRPIAPASLPTSALTEPSTPLISTSPMP